MFASLAVTAVAFHSYLELIAKVGFGACTHKLAKLRTAEEIAAGEPHPEAVWVSSSRKADAAPPPT